MKPAFLFSAFTFVLALLTTAPAMAQQEREQDTATAYRQEQLDMRWATYTAKVEGMKRIKKRDRPALETEYNAMIDDIDALYHLRPAKAESPKEPMIIGSTLRISQEKNLR